MIQASRAERPEALKLQALKLKGTRPPNYSGSPEQHTTSKVHECSSWATLSNIVVPSVFVKKFIGSPGP